MTDSHIAPSVPTRRLLGLDHGTTVIGVAISDAGGHLARPLQLITRSTRIADFSAIAALINSFQISGIVVGLPFTTPEFTAESQMPTVQRWAARLAGTIARPVYLWDETLSSDEAYAIGQQIGRSERDRIDDLAAAIILQGFLNQFPPGTAFPEPVTPGRHATPLK